MDLGAETVVDPPSPKCASESMWVPVCTYIEIA
jgi:hypothetical protein